MPLSKSQFLWIATAFEGGLVLIAYALGAWASIDPLESLRIDVNAVFWGVIGSLLLFGLFIVSERMEATRHIREFLIEKMGGLLAGCSSLELLYLGFLAGITEEILFRGVLQPWLERDWGWAGGLVFSNLIFALVHWITPTYALLAGLCGLFLGLMLDIGPERNLLAPILTHAIYDFLAFKVVAQAWREGQATS
jgi:membrane protease YdiL (CAAX protease family)